MIWWRDKNIWKLGTLNRKSFRMGRTRLFCFFSNPQIQPVQGARNWFWFQEWARTSDIDTSRLIVSPSFTLLLESRNKKQKNDIQNTPLVMFENWPLPWPQCARGTTVFTCLTVICCHVSILIFHMIVKSCVIASEYSYGISITIYCEQNQTEYFRGNSCWNGTCCHLCWSPHLNRSEMRKEKMIYVFSCWCGTLKNEMHAFECIFLEEYRMHWRKTVYQVSASHRRIYSQNRYMSHIAVPKLRTETERKKRNCLLSDASILFHRRTCECAGKQTIAQLAKLQRQIKIKMLVKSGGNKNDNDYFSDR